MMRRIPKFVGFALCYVTAGLTAGAVASGVLNVPTFFIYGWPLMAFAPEYWVFLVIGAVTGVGALSVADYIVPVSLSPRFLPTIQPQQFGIFAGAMLLAELLSRVISTAIFVLYFYVFPPIRGSPPASLSGAVELYPEAMRFMGERWGHSHVFLFGHLLPRFRSIPSGGPEVIHVLFEVGDMVVANGIGFSVILGYPIAVVLSYLVVRKVSQVAGASHLNFRAKA